MTGEGRQGPRDGVDMVYFDIDDTLYDQAAPFAYAVRRTFGALPGVTDGQLYEARGRHSGPVFRAFSEGRAPTGDEYALRMQQTLAEFGIRATRAEALEAQRVYADESGVAMSLSPAMAACLDVCRGRAQLGVGVISNGREPLQGEKLQVLGVGRWVAEKDVLVSQEVGLAKPDPALFRLACERAGTVPERCAYVGDAWATDVVGAWRARMPVAWLNRRHHARPTASEAAPTWEVGSEEALLALVRGEGFWRR